MFELTCRGKRPRSIRDSHPGAADDVVAMQGHEIVQHRSPLFAEAPDVDCEASTRVPSQDPTETSDATATERRSQDLKESVGVAQANMIPCPPPRLEIVPSGYLEAGRHHGRDGRTDHEALLFAPP